RLTPSCDDISTSPIGLPTGRAPVNMALRNSAVMRSTVDGRATRTIEIGDTARGVCEAMCIPSSRRANREHLIVDPPRSEAKPTQGFPVCRKITILYICRQSAVLTVHRSTDSIVWGTVTAAMQPADLRHTYGTRGNHDQ